jgi:hypothetical protein
MATRRKTTPSPVTRKANVDTQPAVPDTGLGDVGTYMTDAWQRTFLFWDTLRRRGNTYTEHVRAGARPRCSSSTMKWCSTAAACRAPCNYALLHADAARRKCPPTPGRAPAGGGGPARRPRPGHRRLQAGQ